MNKSFIQVDQDKCTKCGVCATVCPGVLTMGGNGPQVIRDLCVSCGQCVAVCPTGALDNENTPLDKQQALQALPPIDEQAAAQFLRARRSIRNYQPQAVPRDKILKLLDIARMAPTACNSQGVAYHVVDRPDTLQQLAAVVIDWLAGELQGNPVLATAKYAPHMAMMVASYRQTGEDVVFRSAPCLLVALADKDSLAGGRDNTYIALAYAQLYATAQGLGTCWAGLFEYCAAAQAAEFAGKHAGYQRDDGRLSAVYLPAAGRQEACAGYLAVSAIV